MADLMVRGAAIGVFILLCLLAHAGAPGTAFIGINILAIALAARLGRWYVLQIAVFLAVMYVGCYVGWVQNGGGQGLSFIAVGVAYLATVTVAAAAAAARSLLQTLRSPRSPPKELTLADLIEEWPPLGRD